MVYPHFVETLPLWMNIGSLGWLLAHEIGHAVEKYIAAVPYSAVTGPDASQVYKSAKFRVRVHAIVASFPLFILIIYAPCRYETSQLSFPFRVDTSRGDRCALFYFLPAYFCLIP